MPDDKGKETEEEKKLRKALKRKAIEVRPKGTEEDIRKKIKKKKKKEEGE